MLIRSIFLLVILVIIARAEIGADIDIATIKAAGVDGDVGTIIDDLDSIVCHGHLKIIGLYDYRLLIVNSREEFFTLELYHPFTKFMMFL